MPQTITLTEPFRHPMTTLLLERDSIAVSLVDAALRCAESRDVARLAMLHAAGIESAMLNSPLARVSPAQYGRLWHAIADALDDEFFSQDPHPMRRGSFVLMCHAVLSARDGAQALTRIVGFMRLVLDELSFDVDMNDERVRIWLTDKEARCRYSRTRPRSFWSTACCAGCSGGAFRCWQRICTARNLPRATNTA